MQTKYLHRNSSNCEWSVESGRGIFQFLNTCACSAELWCRSLEMCPEQKGPMEEWCFASVGVPEPRCFPQDSCTKNSSRRCSQAKPKRREARQARGWSWLSLTISPRTNGLILIQRGSWRISFPLLSQCGMWDCTFREAVVWLNQDVNKCLNGLLKDLWHINYFWCSDNFSELKLYILRKSSPLIYFANQRDERSQSSMDWVIWRGGT